jgi:predicted kinase
LQGKHLADLNFRAFWYTVFQEGPEPRRRCSRSDYGLRAWKIADQFRIDKPNSIEGAMEPRIYWELTMLIILGGLPGTGKTTIARELARQLGAVHVRIDSIEEAILDSGVLSSPINDAGYRVGYAVAADNLRIGRTVIADSVNPIPLSRDAWVEVANRAQISAVEIEVTCSDIKEHQHRVETRISDIARSRSLTWQDVVSRDYRPWSREPIVIDTASRTVEQVVTILRGAIPKQ